MNKTNRGIIDFSDAKEYENPDGSITTVYSGKIEVAEAGEYAVNAYPQLKKTDPSQKVLKLTLKIKDKGLSYPADISEFI